MSYLCGSGYIGGDKARQDFYLMRNRLLDQNTDFNPTRMLVICSRAQRPPPHGHHWIQEILLQGNLGHICRDGQGNFRHHLEGWACDVITLALLAYNDESDFLFIEEDCLPFGRFVSQLQEECGNEGMIFGSNSWMPSAQSLFYVRHSFIPDFVHAYLGKKLRDRKMGGEQAFAELEREFSGKVKRMSFGFDRDRPPGGFASMRPEDIWYVQQISLEELRQLRECGHIV